VIDFLGLIYDVAKDNIPELLVMLLIGGFVVYVFWMGVKTIFSGKDKNKQRVLGAPCM